LSQKTRKIKSAPRSRDSWWLAALILAGVLAYWNSFDAPLVFDDLLTIQRNAAVRFGDFDWHLLNPRAVLYLTFTLNYAWTQQEVWSYHLINLIFHLLNSILIFFIAQHIFRRLSYKYDATWAALLAAGFFVLHPVQTESVTYISSRSELLSTGFYLLGFLAFIKIPERRIGFLLSLLLAIPFVLGLGSKETAISFPAALFIYDFIFLSSGSFRPMLTRWRFYVTFLIGGIAAGLYIVFVNLRGSVGVGLAGHLSTLQYFLTQLRVIVRYVLLILLPVGQNLDYDFRPSTSPFEPAVIASFFFLGALVFLAWFLRRRSPVLSFSILWFFLTLAPTSSFIPILDVIFEHRLYLPLAGVCLSFPVLADLAGEQVRKRFAVKIKAVSLASALLLLLMIATVMRNQVWRDEVRLWTDVVSKSPHKVRAHSSLAWAYFKRGQYDQAIGVINSAITLAPASRRDLRDVLGNLFFQTGRYDDAVKLFTEGTHDTDQGVLPMEYNNLGVAYLYKWNRLQSQHAQIAEQEFLEQKEKILRAALQAYETCVRLDRAGQIFGAVDSIVNIASFLEELDDLETKALARLEDKTTFNDLYIVGKVAFQRGNYARADEYFEKAEKVRQDEKLVYFNHGYALNALNQKDRAIDKYLQAIRTDPIFSLAHHNLALIYMQKSDFPRAIEHFQEVLRYDPNHLETNLNLAKIYGAEGKMELARKHLTTVMNVSPGNPQVMQIWQQLGL